MVLYLTDSSGQERVWQPPLDGYFARRINAECRATGSVEKAQAANLLLFALAEATRDGNDPNASGEELVALVTRGYRCIRWVEKKFSLVWAEGGGFSLEEGRTVKLELAGTALESAVAAAVSLEQAAGGGGVRGRSPSPARRRSKRG